MAMWNTDWKVEVNNDAGTMTVSFCGSNPRAKRSVICFYNLHTVLGLDFRAMIAWNNGLTLDKNDSVEIASIV